MCVIVDANLLSQFFSGRASGVYGPVYDWIDCGPGKLVAGGRKLAREIARVKAALRQISVWKAAGRARYVPDAIVDLTAAGLEASGACRSDDHHILAVAQVSGARLLCTEDGDLRCDFTNARIVSNPKGHVYGGPNARRLLDPVRGARCQPASCATRGTCG
jgi:hypothetical protein